METKTQQAEYQIVLTDREKDTRNRSISLYGHHKLSESCLATKSYAIVKRGQRPPKLGMKWDQYGNYIETGCGTTLSVVMCPEYTVKEPGHTKDEIVEHCKSIQCSICNEVALKRQVASAILPHKALDEVLKASQTPIPDSHVVISPPKRMFTKDLVADKGLKPLWKFLDNFFDSYNLGLLASTSVIHLYRLKHSDGSGCDDPECNLQHQSEWGPHFHNAGKIYLMPTNEIRKDYDGKLTVKKMPNLYGKRIIGATLKYELDHSSAVIKNKTGRSSELYHKFGEISKRRMHRTLLNTDHYPVKCQHSKCSQIVLDYEIDRSEGTGSNTVFPAGFHTRTDQVWSYRFDRFPDLEAIVHSDHILETRAYRSELSPKVIA